MNHVVKITNNNNKYQIFMNNNAINGWLFCSSGSVTSRDNMIIICEKEEKTDYDAISEWIKNTHTLSNE